MKKILFCSFMILSLVGNAQNYILTDSGSNLHFVIKNFGINTGGNFKNLAGKIIFDAKYPAKCFFDVNVAVKTIDTDNSKRDEHLRKAAYFNAAQYPIIRLVSTKIEAGPDLKHFIFYGNLTIRNITKAVQFPFTAEGRMGGAEFAGSLEINRIDYGVGGESFSLSDKVKITINTFAKLQ